jgi:Flp pilus assembly protein TadG
MTVPRLSRPPWLRRLAADRRGATALEFALVATPFFFMLFAIFELALVYLVSVSLDNATQQAARLVRTGQAQTGGYTASQFVTQVCANMGWLQSQCSANLFVDAETKTAFGASNPSSPVQGGAWNAGNLKWSIGGPGDIVVLHTYYKWKLITPVLYGGLQQLPGGLTVVVSNATFRNEPYQ